MFFEHECHMLHHWKFIPFNSITAYYGIKICMIMNYTGWENIISWWDQPTIWLLLQFHDASIVDWCQLCIEANAIYGLYQNGRIIAPTHMHHSVSPGPPPTFLLAWGEVSGPRQDTETIKQYEMDATTGLQLLTEEATQKQSNNMRWMLQLIYNCWQKMLWPTVIKMLLIQSTFKILWPTVIKMLLIQSTLKML